MRPVIGLPCREIAVPGRQTPFYGAYATYVAAIARAGGATVLLPLQPDAELAAALEACAGLMLVGGEDLGLPFTDANADLRGARLPPRDAMELQAVRSAIAARTPLLGICRGLQILNCAFGGSIAPIASAKGSIGDVEHRGADGGDAVHSIRVTAGSRLATILAEKVEFNVVSRHTYGVRDVASELRTVATAPDGLAEALEHPGLPVVGVQWHPEMEQGRVSAGPLFDWLVSMAKVR